MLSFSFAVAPGFNPTEEEFVTNPPRFTVGPNSVVRITKTGEFGPGVTLLGVVIVGDGGPIPGLMGADLSALLTGSVAYLPVFGFSEYGLEQLGNSLSLAIRYSDGSGEHDLPSSNSVVWPPIPNAAVIPVVPRHSLESAVAPQPSQLVIAELAFNAADGVLYAKLLDGSVVALTGIGVLTVDSLTDSSAIGRSLLRASNAASARTLLDVPSTAEVSGMVDDAQVVSLTAARRARAVAAIL